MDLSLMYYLIKINFPSLMITHLTHCITHNNRIGYGNLLTTIFFKKKKAMSNFPPVHLLILNLRISYRVSAQVTKMTDIGGCREKPLRCISQTRSTRLSVVKVKVGRKVSILRTLRAGIFVAHVGRFLVVRSRLYTCTIYAYPRAYASKVLLVGTNYDMLIRLIYISFMIVDTYH